MRTQSRLAVAIDSDRLLAWPSCCLDLARGINGRWTDGKILAGKHDGTLIP